MKTLVYFAVMGTAILLPSRDARAIVLDFENVPGFPLGDVIPNGYGGLNWSHFDFEQPGTPDTGYNHGVISPTHIAFNVLAFNTMGSDVYGPQFDFIGTYLTSAFRDDLQVTVTGSTAGTQLYQQTVSLSFTSPTWFEFDFLGIDRLHFESFGGTVHPGIPGAGATGHNFAMDGFTFTPVPEPSTLALLAIGGIGICLHRKRRLN